MPDAAMLLSNVDPFFFPSDSLSLSLSPSLSLPGPFFGLSIYLLLPLQGIPSLSVRLESPTDGVT